MKVHNGIYYFPSQAAARDYAIANGHPTDRLISYLLGWAIQLRVSGPYVGPDHSADVISALKKQFEALDATHISAEEAIARSILRSLDGYDTGAGWRNADIKFLTSALVAYAQILRDHGAKA